jgi:hypothetical protein
MDPRVPGRLFVNDLGGPVRGSVVHDNPFSRQDSLACHCRYRGFNMLLFVTRWSDNHIFDVFSHFAC